MNTQLGILFLHHKIDEVVLNNLSSIRAHNPEAILATISAEEPLPHGYTLEATPELKRIHASNPHRSSDWLVCSWFLQRKEQCRRWWIIEWDTFCRIPADQYYAPVWDFPFVASQVFYRYRNPEWYWFSATGNMPGEYRPYAMGASPFLYLLSETALSAICNALLDKPFCAGNGELRFATVANKCGYAPCGYSPPNDQITWISWNSISDKQTVFHPVKHISS